MEETIDNGFLEHAPDRLIGDKAYDSNRLDERLREERGVELIAPHLSTRQRKTQDGRPLRRYRRRWKVERLFAWPATRATPRTSWASSTSDASASC